MKKMKITEKRIYFTYISLGLMYFISKVVYYGCGFVYFRGVILGLIAAVATISIGVLYFRGYEKGEVNVAVRWLTVLIPLIIIILTPIIMVHNLGNDIFQIEKITILMIFECLALMQIILALLMFRSLRGKP